ncbi:ArnT family glycosyltransferase [Thermococcus siculi]|uniref:ArnT family glycosyltransferase n=1 Tax=Thermococcus siculi TaxID=72803 RepID=UPI0018DF97A1|nr:glycosyltransferase family 39 protein [Thermococcus siculi]
MIYFTTRLISITLMNEYIDYDEGTYLLMARLINQGHLLYRDIFAVHPPLYYYILALWLRIFGDTYIVGRLLSVFVGALSVVLAYLVGRELRDEKLGLLFSLLLVLDPTILRINRLVLHNTFIEFFVLFSMYYLVKYQKTHDIRYAYFSLALAGIGSTVKFTIIPYLVALYIVLVLMSIDDLSWNYVKAGIRTVLSSSQVFVILTLYLLLAASIVALRMAWPSWITRDIIVLLGIHPFSKVGHKYIGGLIVVSWALLTIYLFNCQYVRKLAHIFVQSFRNLKLLLYLALAVLVPKVAIEFFLGYAVSPEYIHQTYLLQSSRYFSFAAVFELVSNVIHDFHVGPHELAYMFVPTFLLLTFLLILMLKDASLDVNYTISLLFIMNFAMYLLLFPIIPNVRFLVPLFMVFYLFMLDTIISSKGWLTSKRLAAGVAIFLIIISMTDYGLLVNLPQGKLDIAGGIYTTKLRRDASLYLGEHQCEKSYSVNPMNTYYLQLDTVPELVDSFGLLYMADFPPEELVSSLRENRVNCIILSTWMEEITRRNSDLAELYWPLKRYTIVNGTPIFSESYSRGDFIVVFRMVDIPKNLTVVSSNGKLVLLYNLKEAIEIYPQAEGQNFSQRTFVQNVGNGSFIVRWYNADGGYTEANLLLKGDYLVVTPKNSTVDLVLTFDGVATNERGDIPEPNMSENYLNIYTNGVRFYAMGKSLSCKENIIYSHGANSLKIGVNFNRS